MPDSAYFELSSARATRCWAGRRSCSTPTAARSTTWREPASSRSATSPAGCRTCSGPIWMPAEDECAVHRAGTAGELRSRAPPRGPGRSAPVRGRARRLVRRRQCRLVPRRFARRPGGAAHGDRRAPCGGPCHRNAAFVGRRRCVGTLVSGRPVRPGRRNRVLARDGSLVAELPQTMSDWSPDSLSLAAGNTIVRRDGTDRGRSRSPFISRKSRRPPGEGTAGSPSPRATIAAMVARGISPSSSIPRPSPGRS